VIVRHSLPSIIWSGVGCLGMATVGIKIKVVAAVATNRGTGLQDDEDMQNPVRV
jgi:hypothetical protein